MKGKSKMDRDGEWDTSYSIPLNPGNPYSSSSPPPGPSEVEEEVPASAACCRICLEFNGDQGEELICPCMCKGTQQFVHRSCLDHWRSVKEGFAFSHCTTCKAQYHLRVNFLEGYCWRKIRFRMFVTRDILLVFLAMQIVIFILGGIVFLLDRDGKLRSGWDHIFPNHPIPFYYCTGVLAFLVLLGFFGMLLQCSAYSIPFSSSSSRSTSEHLSSSPGTGSSESIYCCNGPCFMNLSCCSSESESNDDCYPLIVFCIIVFAILGIFYGFIAATIAIQRIWQRHYHILTKRELTKEYVVEDLHGHYTPPKLDRQHEERLRILKLL